MHHFRKLSQMEIPKNRRKLYNDVNISMSKNWKNGKNSRNCSKFEQNQVKISTMELFYNTGKENKYKWRFINFSKNFLFSSLYWWGPGPEVRNNCLQLKMRKLRYIDLNLLENTVHHRELIMKIKVVYNIVSYNFYFDQKTVWCH